MVTSFGKLGQSFVLGGVLVKELLTQGRKWGLTRNNSADVDGGVLLLASHHVESLKSMFESYFSSPLAQQKNKLECLSI